jgi:hypothetical protein
MMKSLKGKIFATLLTALIATNVIYGVMNWGDAPSRSNAASRSPDRSDACFMSQKFVKQDLKAPSTAEFPLWNETNCQVSRRKRIWVVNSYVDAQNSFGAMIRSNYAVEMIYYPATDAWTLVDISIVGP